MRFDQETILDYVYGLDCVAYDTYNQLFIPTDCSEYRDLFCFIRQRLSKDLHCLYVKKKQIYPLLQPALTSTLGATSPTAFGPAAGRWGSATTLTGWPTKRRYWKNNQFKYSSTKLFFTFQRNWFTAFDKCRDDFGGKLAEIRSQDQQDFVVDHLNDIYFNHDLWIGASDLQMESFSSISKFFDKNAFFLSLLRIYFIQLNHTSLFHNKWIFLYKIGF